MRAVCPRGEEEFSFTEVEFQLVGVGRWGGKRGTVGVVCITVEENPCDVTAEPGDLVYNENRSGPSTEP